MWDKNGLKNKANVKQIKDMFPLSSSRSGENGDIHIQMQVIGNVVIWDTIISPKFIRSFRIVIWINIYLNMQI